MDKVTAELQSTIETAIFEYERVAKKEIVYVEVHRIDELDFQTIVVHKDEPECPHGRLIGKEYMPAFAGGVSTCSCCGNGYGHFGEPPDNRCSACHEVKS